MPPTTEKPKGDRAKQGKGYMVWGSGGMERCQR